jgi:hypothetical protein
MGCAQGRLTYMTAYKPSQFDDLKFLQAVSDWQRGGDAKQNLRRGLALKAACAHLTEQFRTSSLDCFRQVGLKKGSVWDLIGENHLTEKVSSWTYDIEVAKAFKGGVPPDGQGYQGVIFCINPPPSNCVIVNLRELYGNHEFRDAMERNKSTIEAFSDGAGLYWDRQSEVVLEIEAVSQEDIYSLGGHSSPFDQLVALAADLTYGREANPQEVGKLLLMAEHLRKKAGPKWLTPEATKRVLARTKPKAEALAEIKRNQADWK